MNFFYTDSGSVIHHHFLIAAYSVFVVVMLWDWISPKLQISRALSAARKLARRRAARAAQGEHPR